MNSDKIKINGTDNQVYEFHKDHQLLGHGAFGIVVKGKNTSNQNDVAVKIVKNLSGRQEMLAREIEILKVLTNTQNENIVSLFAVEKTALEVFMVIEYCNYKDFGHYLKAKGVLSEIEIKYFFKQVVNGLKTLHEKEIIHRDLKPENLMLSNPTGLINPPFNKLVVKISDFGLSRFLPEGSLASTGGCGTPYYMAPEVVLSQSHDSKADIWSLGMIIYECLTNSLPLKKEGISGITQLTNFYQTKSKFNLEMPENVTKGLSDIIVKSLEQNVQERISFEHFISNPFFTGGITCLMVASIQNKIETVRYLLKKGADLNRKDEKGSTALHYAAQNNNDNKLIVKLLLEHGADIEHQSTEGVTCLMHATYKNNIEIVRYLLEKDADLNKKDTKGSTVLHYAANNENDNKLIVKLLLEHGADIEHQNTNSTTCLMTASYKNNIKIVHYLLEKGADLSKKNNNGDTALHYAAANKNDNILIIKLLLEEHSAYIEYQNTNGFTCLMEASCANNIEIVRYLLEKGADPNKINKDDETALHIARKKSNNEIIELLSKYIKK